MSRAYTADVLFGHPVLLRPLQELGLLLVGVAIVVIGYQRAIGIAHAL